MTPLEIFAASMAASLVLYPASIAFWLWLDSLPSTNRSHNR